MEDLNSITLPTLHTPSSAAAAAAAILPGFPVLPSSRHTTENMFVSAGSLDSPQASILSIHTRIGDGSSSSLHSPRPPPPSSSNRPFDHETSSPQEIMNPASDRRLKRVIKNRESAARSRARKQAYTNELELRVAQLKQENESLRTEQEMLSQAAVDQPPLKRKLHRTSTALF